MGTAQIVLTAKCPTANRLRLLVYTDAGLVLDGQDGLARAYASAQQPFFDLVPVDPVSDTYVATIPIDSSFTGTLTPAAAAFDEYDVLIGAQRVEDAVIYVEAGVIRNQLTRSMRALTEDTPGSGALSIKDDHGALVPDGRAYVYYSEEYAADPEQALPITTISAGADGRWSSHPLLPTGVTYSVVIVPGGVSVQRVVEVSL